MYSLNNTKAKKTIFSFNKKTISEEKYNEIKEKNRDYFPYIRYKGTIVYVGKEKDRFFVQPISTDFVVKEKLIDVDNSISKVKISYLNGGEYKETIFDSDIFSKNGIKSLLSYGIRFNEKNAELLIQYLIISEGLAEEVKTYKKLGWVYDEGELQFKLNTIISKSLPNTKYYYEGKIDISPSGSFEQWNKMIGDEVIGNCPLEFVMLSALSSPLLALANKRYELGAIVFSLSNTSSKGKTTAAMLATSVFSNPTLNKGTMITFNTTENALNEFVAQSNGVSVALDEAIIFNSNDIQKILYTICSGRSKMRLDGNSEIREVKEFSSVIFTTAEYNLIDDDNLDGIRTRVFELSENFTTSAKNSENIKQTVLDNYGHAGSKFILHLIEKGEGTIFEDYEVSKEELRQQFKSFLCDKTIEIKKYNIVERIISKLALVYLSAKYYNEIFEYKVNMDNISNYINNIIYGIVHSTTPEEELLNVVLEDVNSNIKKYYRACRFIFAHTEDDFEILDDYTDAYKTGCVGLVRESKEKGFIEVCVFKEHFKALMRRRNIIDVNKRLRNLKAEGLLLAEDDRNSQKVKVFDKMRNTAYVFKYRM